ncbi:uncharacterized protein LOC135196703 [Macrobrachium nipponense]|uniref:uncharacterized protein LOC135196703 n=1 Tax=Macrobrachium nipponense TaxID=159736 RepID=UPI0030C7FBD2
MTQTSRKNPAPIQTTKLGLQGTKDNPTMPDPQSNEASIPIHKLTDLQGQDTHHLPDPRAETKRHPSTTNSPQGDPRHPPCPETPPQKPATHPLTNRLPGGKDNPPCPDPSPRCPRTHPLTIDPPGDPRHPPALTQQEPAPIQGKLKRSRGQEHSNHAMTPAEASNHSTNNREFKERDPRPPTHAMTPADCPAPPHHN